MTQRAGSRLAIVCFQGLRGGSSTVARWVERCFGECTIEGREKAPELVGDAGSLCELRSGRAVLSRSCSLSISPLNGLCWC